MAINYSKLTAKSRGAIQKAHAITKECGYEAIEPQVMMVAILQENQEMISFLLNKMNIDKITFCQAVGDSMSLINHNVNVAPDISASLHNVLAHSEIVAANFSSSVIAIEHIFAAFRGIENPVQRIMASLGITEQGLHAAIELFRNGNNNAPIATDESQSNNRSNYRNLNKYAQNLIVLAEEGKIEPVIGRDDEIRRILQIISRKSKNNPILIGEPGTGKTAIVEGLAHRIIRGDVPMELRGIRLFSLDITALVAGASAQGEFEERLKKIIEEATENPDVILFIDEVHLLVGAGKSCGAMDAANILKPELARGKLKIISATTLDEYQKYIEKDKAFERRLQKVVVNEPDEESAISIMRGIKIRYEEHHKIKILDEAIVSSVELSSRYITDRFLPDKAIDLIDEAAARLKIERSSVPDELDAITRLIRRKEIEKESIRRDNDRHQNLQALELEIANLREDENTLNAKWNNERTLLDALQNHQNELVRLETEVVNAEQLGQYNNVVVLNEQISTLKAKINKVVADFNELSNNNILKVALDDMDIKNVVESWTGIPISKLSEDESDKLINLESILQQRIIGQDAAVSAVANVIRRNRIGLNDSRKPIGSLLFLGTTGIGKTELCKVLADYMFDSRDMIVRIDMSEYQQEYSVSRLFGAPPGYVGYDQGGQLTEQVRRKPYSVVLFDEIEKAHPNVFETLLQILDDGRMTDGQGRVVNFKNTIIIMTSNIGSEHIFDYGLTVSQNQNEAMKQDVITELKAIVAPEFLNRIDETVLFLPLQKSDISKIVELQLEDLKQSLSNNGINISFDSSVITYITEKGYNPEYGARSVKRAINDYVVNDISMKLLSKEIVKDRQIQATVLDAHLVFVNIDL